MQDERIGEEIEKVDELVASLTRYRATLQRAANSPKPIHRLPPEILIEIFLHLCHQSAESLTSLPETASPGPSESTPAPTKNGLVHVPPVVTPLFLGSICSYWRAIIWSTPLLWCNINLPITSKLGASQLSILREWLLRAREKPLHIKLLTPADAPEGAKAFASLHAVLRVLMERSAYWDSIDCVLPTACHGLLRCGELDGSCPGEPRFPRLRKVAFRPPKGLLASYTPPDMLEALSMPMLQDVELSGYTNAIPTLPWTQLRTLKIHISKKDECADILSKCPNLESLDITPLDNTSAYHFSSSVPPLPSQHPLALPRNCVHNTLRRLSLTFTKTTTLSLLNTLTLPALCSLSLSNPSTDRIPLDPISSLVARSACPLTPLSLCSSGSHFNET